MAISKFKKISLYKIFLLALLLILALSYGHYFKEIFTLGDYYPSRSDEMGYFLEAKGFAQTGRVAPFVMQDEMIAPLFDLGPHGPMYAFTHGMFAKIFGLRGINFVIMNVLFLLGYFLFVARSKFLDWDQKLTLFVIQYGYFITFFFTFAFNQELIHIFFAAWIALTLISLYDKHRQSPELLWPDIMVFVSLLMLAASYRYGWVLSIFAVIPLAKNKLDLVKLISVSFVVIAIGQVYRKYFHAASDYTLLQDLPGHIAAGRFDEVWQELSGNIVINLRLFFVSVYKYANYYYSKLIFFALSCYFFFLGIAKKDRLLLGVSLLALSNFAALIVLYNAYDYRETRGLAAILAILVIVMVYRKLKIATFVVLAYTVISFPCMFKEFDWLIFEKNIASTKLYQEKKVLDFSSFAQAKSNGKKLITILIPEKLFWLVTPGRERAPSIKDILHTPLLTAPSKNFEGVPLRYTFNYWEINQPYRQKGQIPIDYVYVPEKGLLDNNPELIKKALKP